MFTIQEATVEDCPLIHGLAARIWEDTYKGIHSKGQSDYMFEMMYAPERIREQMEVWHHRYFIISTDGMPAGYLSIERKEEDTYIFQKVYSLPETHGTGIGRFIMERGIEYVKTIHPAPFTIELYVNRENQAIGFYEHLGFKNVGNYDKYIGNGYYMRGYTMTLRVFP